MSFNGLNPESLRDGKERANAATEKSSTFGLIQGSPAKFAKEERHAGDVFFKNRGVHPALGGDFARNLENNQDAKDGTKNFVTQWTNGPWSPFDMGPPPGQGGAPVETA